MKTGDRVVCVKAGSNAYGIGVVKGRIYVINNIKADCSCGAVYYDVGISAPLMGTFRCKCGIEGGIMNDVFVQSTFFAPIEYTTCHDELINIVEERIDIEIKEPVL